MNGLRFLLAQATFVAFGAFAAFIPGVRRLTAASRVAIAFLTGAVLLTLEATLFSSAGIRWNPGFLALPLISLSVVLLLSLAGRSAPGERGQVDRAAAVVALLVALIPLLHVAGSFAIARGVSADYVYFWGVKASRFVAARGIDPELLRWRFFDHAVPDYPPLIPVIQGWASMLSAGMAWTVAPVVSAIWLVAAGAALHGLFDHRWRSRAVAPALFWFSALSISAVHSYSGGNAETPLLAFITVGCAALIVERRSERWTRALAAMAFAGALLTKVEALVAWGAILAGTVARDLWLDRPEPWKRALPIVILPSAALSGWFFYQWRAGLPVGYEPHGEIFLLHWANLPAIISVLPRHLQAGAWGLGWIIPIMVIVAGPIRSWKTALPALAGVAALFAFFVFDYLHDPLPPIERIGWTLPRISQPALSLWILAAAVMAHAGEENAVEPGEEREFRMQKSEFGM